MSKMTFVREAKLFAVEIGALIILEEDADSVDERYMAFTEMFSKKLISKSTEPDFDLDDAIASIKLVQAIPDFHGDPFEGAIRSDMQEAAMKILTPSRVFEHMLKTGTPPETEIVLNGVKMTLKDASRFYYCLAGVHADIASTYKDFGTVTVENDYFAQSGFNPFQREE